MLYFEFQFTIQPPMTDASDIIATLNFDPDALREKYRLERDKRIRAAGNQQYLEVDGDFSNYIDDPYGATIETREPLTDTVDVVIIGGAMMGASAAWSLSDDKDFDGKVLVVDRDLS